MSKTLTISPTTLKKANQFIKEHHRHHRPTTRNSGRWSLAAHDINGNLVGVAIAGNPVSPNLMDGKTIELTRVCTKQGAPKGTCSFLLAKCCRVWQAMGGERVITYTLDSESGASLRGAGWKLAGTVQPHKRWQNRAKVDGIERESLHIYSLKKHRWEKLLKEAM
ncbi:XF1762 family protein [Vreelandella venusta]|uniref:XF1762 family protein n=1 Tax=Vreelandella venusta TaxID=44935 RepID=UPI003F67B627